MKKGNSSEVCEKLRRKRGLARSSSKNSQPDRMGVMETKSHIFNREKIMKLSSGTRMSHLRTVLMAKNHPLFL